MLKRINIKEINWFKILYIILGTILLLLMFHYSYGSIITNKLNQPKQLIRSDNNGVALDGLDGDITIAQDFELSQEDMKYIKVRFAVRGQEYNGKVKVSLIRRDTKELIQSWELEEAKIRKQNYQEFHLDTPLVVQEKTKFELKIEIVGTTAENAIMVNSTPYNAYNQGELIVNQEKMDGDLVFYVYGANNRFLNKLYVLMILAIVLGFVAIAYVNKHRKLSLERCYIVAALFLGVLYMVTLPPYTTPDERGHTSTVFYYSDVILGEKAVDDQGNVMVRNEELKYSPTHAYPSLGSYGLIASHLFDKSEDDTMVSYGRTPLGAPVWSYAPQIIGVSIARILNLNGILTLFLGRFLSLLFFIACMYAAIRLMPFGKAIMYVIGLLPMTLSIAGSFSYDMMVNGLCFVFIAYVLYLAYDKKQVGYKDWGILFAIMLVMAPCKVVYVLLAFMCFIIPAKKNKSKMIKYVGSTVTILGGLVGVLALRLQQMTSIATNGVEYWSGKQGYDISYLFQEPMKVIHLSFNTIRQIGDAVIQPVFGGKLGNWDISIPWYLVIGFIIVLVMAIIEDCKRKKSLGVPEKSLFFLIIMGVVGAVFLSMFLDFTSVGDAYVKGVQGRYFLPVLPLIVLLFQNKNFYVKDKLESNIVMATFVLNALVVWRIFETIIVR